MKFIIVYLVGYKNLLHTLCAFSIEVTFVLQLVCLDPGSTSVKAELCVFMSSLLDIVAHVVIYRLHI